MEERGEYLLIGIFNVVDFIHDPTADSSENLLLEMHLYFIFIHSFTFLLVSNDLDCPNHRPPPMLAPSCSSPLSRLDRDLQRQCVSDKTRKSSRRRKAPQTLHEETYTRAL